MPPPFLLPLRLMQAICGGVEPKGGPAHMHHRKVAVDALFARRLGAILKM